MNRPPDGYDAQGRPFWYSGPSAFQPVQPPVVVQQRRSGLAVGCLWALAFFGAFFFTCVLLMMLMFA